MKKLLLTVAVVILTLTGIGNVAQAADDDIYVLLSMSGSAGVVVIGNEKYKITEIRNTNNKLIFTVYYDIDDHRCGKIYNFPQTNMQIRFLCELD